MAFGGRTKSTAPEAMALRGMPSNFADCGASANVMPPSALIAFSPSAPSDALPERITPIARMFMSSASERRKRSIGMWGPRSSDRCARFRTPSAMVMLVFGGMTYTWPGSARVPCFTSTTGIRVVLDRISLRMLGYFGSRCWTSTKAIAASTDRCASNSENASSPPAEAPMPTIGNASLDGLGAATPPRTGGVARCSRVALLIVEGGVEGRAPRLREAERRPRGDLFIAALHARGLLAQTQLLHRHADVTTQQSKCQAFVRSRRMRPIRPFWA